MVRYTMTFSFSIFSQGQLYLFLLMHVTSGQMLITGVLDTSYTDTNIYGIIELFTTDLISDLSEFGIGMSHKTSSYKSAKRLYSFPAEVISKNSFIYFVSHGSKKVQLPALNTFLGKSLPHVYLTDAVPVMYGYEAAVLYKSNVVHDTFAVVGVDGSKKWWNYHFGWFYRKNGTNANPYWVLSDWYTSGQNMITNWKRNKNNLIPFPLMTFSRYNPRE